MSANHNHVNAPTTRRLPFSKLVHHPTTDLLFLACGGHIQCLDSRSGALVATTIDPAKNGGLPELEGAGRPTVSPTANAAHSGIIRTLGISKDGKRLVSSGEDKLLKVWTAEHELVCLSSRTVQKRVVSLQTTNDNMGIVTADKFGDVYLYPIDKDEDEPVFVLGHVSMLLDLKLSADEKQIVTAERDEKIRVSKFPNGYLIDNYCLGHKELVSAILIPPFAPDRLISGGGDPFLLVWDWKSGEVLQTISLIESLGMNEENAHPSVARPIVTSICASPVNLHVTVALEKYPGLLIFEWGDGRLEVLKKLDLPRDPLDVCFDRTGNLWAAISTSDNGGLENDVELLQLFNCNGGRYSQADPSDPRVRTINRCGSMCVESLPELYPFGILRKDIKSWLKGDFPDINGSGRVNEEQEEENEADEQIRKKSRRGRKKRVV